MPENQQEILDATLDAAEQEMNATARSFGFTVSLVPTKRWPTVASRPQRDSAVGKPAYRMAHWLYAARRHVAAGHLIPAALATYRLGVARAQLTEASRRKRGRVTQAERARIEDKRIAQKVEECCNRGMTEAEACEEAAKVFKKANGEERTPKTILNRVLKHRCRITAI